MANHLLLNRCLGQLARAGRFALVSMSLSTALPVFAGHLVTTVDSSSSVGQYTSLQLNGVQPVVSYYDSQFGDLKLATCTANCLTATPTWVITVVDSLSAVGEYNSLQLNSGSPVVSYYDLLNTDLKLATCTADCATNSPTWVITTVDTGGLGSVGKYTSLQLNGGKPVVSYYDETLGAPALKLATCTANCATAAPTWVISTVDSSSSVGQYSSLQLSAGKPVVSYFDQANGDLKLATCTANCATATPTWVIVTVDSGGTVGSHTSLQLNGGNPVVSYYGSTSGSLKLATCTANCASASPTWVIVTVDSVGDVGQYTSLQLDGGEPVVSYYDQTNGDLKLATCTANCATATPTWVIATVDSSGIVGEYTSLQLNGATPVVSYYDQTNHRLKLAVVDVTAPTVSSVAVPANGTYAAGQVLSFTVNWDDAVIVNTATGTPSLPLTVGAVVRQAAYISGSGTNALTFAYVVAAADVDSDGIALGAAIALNGGTIRDVGFNDAALTLSGVSSTAGVRVLTTYGVIPSAGANGSISPNTSQTVAYGATATFTVTPAAGYTAVVGGTCGGSLAGNTYTTNPIIAACSVTAMFTQNTYTVTPSAGANGTISPDTAQTVAQGATTTFTVTPAAGYIAQVGGTCGGSLVGNTYTTDPITAACSVTATFDPYAADLGISQSAIPGPGQVGKDIVYTLTASNAGPAGATNVVVSDTLPAGSTFVWASPGCTNASGTVSCNVGAMASGANTARTVVARPASAGTATNVASIAGAEIDLSSGNNTSSLDVTVNGVAPGVPILRYRLYSDVTKEHLFTTDLNEYNTLGTYTGTWVQEGTVGQVLDNPGSFGGVEAVPYYRLYDNNTRWHLWTTDANEYYTLGLVYSGWNMEGVDGYILPTQAPGTTQLYRLNYPYLGSLHHWTIDANEYSVLTTSYGWVGEGGSGFVVQ